MKQSNQFGQNNINDPYRKQLNNWQSVIGMPNWSPSNADLDEIRKYDNLGRELQASTVRKSLATGVKWLGSHVWKVTRSLLNWIKQRQLQNANMRELQNLNEQELRDIGLTRTDVNSIIRGNISTSDLNKGQSTVSDIETGNMSPALGFCTTEKAGTSSTTCANDDSDRSLSLKKTA